MIQGNLKKWNRITVGDCLTFPAMIPISRSMLSRDKRLSLDTWNTSGFQENVFGDQFSTFDSSRNHPQGMHNSNADLCKKAVDHEFFFIPVEIPQNPTVGQQRQQISELQFDKFRNLQPFLFWKIRFKNQVTNSSYFPSDAMLWIKEVEMVDSLEELKSSRSACGKNFPNFEMLDAKIALCSEQDHPEFPVQEEGQPRGTESPERGPVSTRKTDCLHDLRLLSSRWRS